MEGSATPSPTEIMRSMAPDRAKIYLEHKAKPRRHPAGIARPADEGRVAS